MNFRTCKSAGRAGLGVLERVCLSTVVSPWTKTPGGLDSWLLPIGSHICAEAPCTVPVRAGCHHSRMRANSGCLGTSVGGTPAEGKTRKCNLNARRSPRPPMAVNRRTEVPSHPSGVPLERLRIPEDGGLCWVDGPEAFKELSGRLTRCIRTSGGRRLDLSS